MTNTLQAHMELCFKKNEEGKKTAAGAKHYINLGENGQCYKYKCQRRLVVHLYFTEIPQHRM